MTDHPALADLSVTDAAVGLRQEDFTARALVDAVLERASSSDPVVHAYSSVDPESARVAADAADAAQSRGDALGRLHGIPVAVGGAVDVPDIATTAGPQGPGSGPAASDAPAVRSLRAAGAIVVGKAWAHELGLSAGSAPTRNSWDPRRSPGGSGAGPAVAVSVGSAAAAISRDTGGSVLVPAALNGVVGFRPTARTAVTGASATGPFPDGIGTYTRSALDALLLFDVMAGLAPDAQDVTPMTDGPHAVAVDVLDLTALGSLSPAVAAAVDTAVAVFAQGGLAVGSVRLPHPGLAGAASAAIAAAAAAHHHRQALRSRWSELEPATPAHLIAGGALPESARQLAETLRDIVIADLDVLLSPFGRPAGLRVLAMPAFPIAPGPAHDLFAGYAAAVPVALETQMLVELAGLPAVTLPCDVGAERMPAALQLVGPRGADRALLRLGAWFQQRTSWHLRSPLAQDDNDEPYHDDETLSPQLAGGSP